MASARLIRESIRASLIPTVDSAKTVGLVSLPGMMSGLIFAGIDPVKAIKYQIMVTFMLLSTASLSTIIACYLTYRKFYNERHQLVVTQLKKRIKPVCVGPVSVSATGHFFSRAARTADDGTSTPAHRRYPVRPGSPGTFSAPDRLRQPDRFAGG